MTYDDPAVNPYDPNSADNESQTQPLDQVIRAAARAQTMLMRVCLPAIVVKVSGDQKVDVQPALQVRYIDQTQGQNLPVVQNVPVSMFMGANYAIRVPVAVDDTGYLVFSDRSLDAWLAGDGQVVDPQDARQHDLSDAIFVPGLVPFSQQTKDGSSDLYVVNGESKAEVRLQQGGSILLGGKSAANPAVLGDVLTNGLDALESALNDLATAMTSLNTASTTFTTAIQTGPIGVSALAAANPINTSPQIIAAATSFLSALSSFASALSTFASDLASFKSQYLDTASSNIVSQQTFLRRGGS